MLQQNIDGVGVGASQVITLGLDLVLGSCRVVGLSDGNGNSSSMVTVLGLTHLYLC